MESKILKHVKTIFICCTVLYSMIAVFYFLKKPFGGGDESLFISDLELINNEGWIAAIKKGISIPFMAIAYPLSQFMKNYLALRLVNILLLAILFFYFYKQKNNFSGSFYGYLLFFISTAGYFYLGTNDTLFFVGLIIFINEVNNLQKEKNWKGTLAFSALIIAFFTRELVIVYSPVIIFCFYVIYKEKGFAILRVPLSLLLLFLVLNIPSFIANGKISYDLKAPPASAKATWAQRQYLAQLKVNIGELANYNHPSWEETDAYLSKYGEKSLPKGILGGLFFDIGLTIEEFFKDFYFCIIFGFRQLAFMLLFPFWFLAKDVYRARKMNTTMLIPISLIMMMTIFSLIIISFVELRWLGPVFILSIVYYANLQKRELIPDRFMILNYGVLVIMSIYGSFNIINKMGLFNL
ncbi:hypothetical protein [Flavobacterium frigoris]|nr:hypothetical protein [Flavobacterium frigoris]